MFYLSMEAHILPCIEICSVACRQSISCMRKHLLHMFRFGGHCSASQRSRPTRITWRAPEINLDNPITFPAQRVGFLSYIHQIRDQNGRFTSFSHFYRLKCGQFQICQNRHRLKRGPPLRVLCYEAHQLLQSTNLRHSIFIIVVQVWKKLKKFCSSVFWS